MVGGLLNRTLDVYRPSTVADGAGGWTTEYAFVGAVRVMVSQPSAQEKEEADQWGARHTHNIYALPTADIRRGDELRDGGQTWRVLATVTPSRAAYLKAVSQLVEPEGS